MKKNDIIEKLHAFPYDSGEYWVITGGAMVLYGFREETGDVDLGCTPKLADRLEADGFLYKTTDDGNRWFRLPGNMEVFENWLYGEVVRVDGIPVISLPGLIAMKKSLGREKDKRDLALIDAKLNAGSDPAPERGGLQLNEYLQNLHRIEFAVTLACTGRCRHCQNGEPAKSAEHIEAAAAEKALRSVVAHYAIETVMTFGGEPLLFPEIVSAIHRTAAELGIRKRQVITNGYFSKDPSRIEEVARMLAESGVNDLRLSADAFHQETIPLGPVLRFAECAVRFGIPVSLSPAWLVGADDDNPYNIRTREILRAFEPLGIPTGKGNVIFPSGNALKYLREYFGENAAPSSPYDEDPRDVRSLSFSPNGDVLDGNIQKSDILDIIRKYRP